MRRMIIVKPLMNRNLPDMMIGGCLTARKPATSMIMSVKIEILTAILFTSIMIFPRVAVLLIGVRKKTASMLWPIIFTASELITFEKKHPTKAI